MKVALLMGGRSSEREISLRTGRGIAQALRNLGHEVLAIDAANGRLLPSGEEEEGAMPAEAVSRLPASSTSAIAHVDAVNEAEVVFVARSTAERARTGRSRLCSSWPAGPTPARECWRARWR